MNRGPAGLCARSWLDRARHGMARTYESELARGSQTPVAGPTAACTQAGENMMRSTASCFFCASRCPLILIGLHLSRRAVSGSPAA